MKLTRVEARVTEAALLTGCDSRLDKALRQLQVGITIWERKHQACKDVCDLGFIVCNADLVEC